MDDLGIDKLEGRRSKQFLTHGCSKENQAIQHRPQLPLTPWWFKIDWRPHFNPGPPEKNCDHSTNSWTPNALNMVSGGYSLLACIHGKFHENTHYIHIIYICTHSIGERICSAGGCNCPMEIWKWCRRPLSVGKHPQTAEFLSGFQHSELPNGGKTKP
jgi:hypothetical protein